MNGEQRRARLIAEMANMSSYSIADLEENFPSFGTTKSLTGFAHISVLLKTKGIRKQNQLALMDYDGQRNTLIVELNKNMFCFDIYKIENLQTLGDTGLYDKGMRLRGKRHNKRNSMHSFVLSRSVHERIKIEEGLL